MYNLINVNTVNLQVSVIGLSSTVSYPRVDKCLRQNLVPFTDEAKMQFLHFIEQLQKQTSMFFTHCGMYIPLSDDKHRKVQDSSKKRTGNPRQIESETKCSSRQNSVQEFVFRWLEKKIFRLNLSPITYRRCISYAIF